MSRTYRNAPNYTFINPDHTEKQKEASFEERLAHYRAECPKMDAFEQCHSAWVDARGAFPKDTFYEGRPLRDKDNHGCCYSKPRSFRKRRNKKARHRADQQLRSMVNEGCRAADFEAMKPLPVPKQYTGWFW